MERENEVTEDQMKKEKSMEEIKLRNVSYRPTPVDNS